jgi:hypothetical protein
MGKVYKRKKRSCSMCKPHKMGIAPKHPIKIIPEKEDIETQLEDMSDEIKDWFNRHCNVTSNGPASPPKSICSKNINTKLCE